MSQIEFFDRFDIIGIQNSQTLNKQSQITLAPKSKPMQAETDVPEFSLDSEEKFQQMSQEMYSYQIQKDLKRKYSQGVKITFLRYMNEQIAQIQKRRTLSL